MGKYDSLKLENQICFPLYAASREIVKQYHPFLTEIDLTYTQYITLMVLWEEKKISVKELGQKLFLDSGTLTPVLKTMESRGLITRKRSEKDERVLIVEITTEVWRSGKRLWMFPSRWQAAPSSLQMREKSFTDCCTKCSELNKASQIFFQHFRVVK